MTHTDPPDPTALRALLDEVPKSGLICADYTMDDNPAWYIIPGSCIGTIATVRHDHGPLAELFALAPALAERVIELEAENAAKDARIAELEGALHAARDCISSASDQLTKQHAKGLEGKKWGWWYLDLANAALQRKAGE